MLLQHLYPEQADCILLTFIISLTSFYPFSISISANDYVMKILNNIHKGDKWHLFEGKLTIVPEYI